jgi:hypothetical protein
MRVGVSSLSRSLFPRQRRRGCQPSLGSLFPNQFFFLLPVSQYLLFETSSTAPGVRSPPPNIGGVVPAGPLKWLPSPPPLTSLEEIACRILAHEGNSKGGGGKNVISSQSLNHSLKPP